MSGAPDLDRLAHLRSEARRRMPNGARMTDFRWAVDGGTVWLFPAAFVGGKGLVSLGHMSRIRTRPAADRTTQAFWLATAMRQDLWRALQGVPGLMPITAARPEGADEMVLTAAAAVPPAKRSEAVQAVLADIFQPRRVGAWAAWALDKAGGPAERDKRDKG